MIPFDNDTMMLMLELPTAPDMGSNRHIEKGPMEGMPEGEAEDLLCKIYCMLKEHFGDECPEADNDEEVEDEL